MKDIVKYGRFTRVKAQEDARVRFWLEAKNGDLITLVRDPIRPEIRVSTNHNAFAIPIGPGIQETITIKQVLSSANRALKR